jgi:hypothetical protein
MEIPMRTDIIMGKLLSTGFPENPRGVSEITCWLGDLGDDQQSVFRAGWEA